jgi:preprotein translocase subunit SecB
MNETTKETNGNGSTAATGQFSLQKIYVKDLSFEAPNAPDVFINDVADQVEPQLQLNLKNSHASLSDDNVEVVLHASIHATQKDRTLFMVEIDQAGLFLIKGYGDEERKTLIGTYCPSTLFPYLRETISSLIGKGGFPAMLLQPINFDALFAQAQQEQAQAQAQRIQ